MQVAVPKFHIINFIIFLIFLLKSKAKNSLFSL